MNHWLHGIFTELVTPFAGAAVDHAALARLVGWQTAQHADGFAVGTATGEGSTLSRQERASVVATIRQAAGRAVPILVAAGTNATEATIEEVEEATRWGANAILLRTPYYNRPTQAGLVEHLRAAAAATHLDIVLDNDPDRCAVELSIPALAELCRTPNIVGVLERRGDLVRCDRIARAGSRQFMRLTGSSDNLPAYFLTGGCGAITGLANLAPHLLSRIQAAIRSASYEQAQMLQRRLIPLHDLLRAQSDPGEIKFALSLMKLGLKPDCRSATGALSPDFAEELADLLPAFELEKPGRVAHLR
ncbi:MAG TPA: dihydrodipicolinate synthase family protein [Bosea sp. (in: a-proteobacteria)]